VFIAIIQSASHIKSIVNEKLVMGFMLELFLYQVKFVVCLDFMFL